MNVMRLIQVGRYFRCRKLFRAPWKSHWATSCVFKKPVDSTLTFLDGTSVTLAERRRFAWLWDIVLGSNDAQPVSVEKGVLRFQYKGDPVELRLDDPEASRVFRRMVIELGGKVTPMLSRGDHFIIHWEGQPLTLALNSRISWSTFAEVFIEDCYHVGDLPDNLGTVVDLGCNAGMFAMRMYPKAKRIISVDAIAGVLELARGNLERNQRADKVILQHNAASDKSGDRIKLWTSLGDSETTTSSVDMDLAGHFGNKVQVEVETVSLPALFKQHDISKCDLLKIDIEAAEFLLFKGIDDETLAKIDRIVMEVHLWGKQDYADQYAGIQSRLVAAGFTVNAGNPRAEDGSLKNVTYLSAARD